jgi:hypothetical protein
MSSAVALNFGLNMTHTLSAGPSTSLKPGSHPSNWDKFSGSFSNNFDLLTE